VQCTLTSPDLSRLLRTIVTSRRVRETFSVGNFRAISGERLAQICDLTVTYSPRNQPTVRALERASLDIHFGEIIGMLGESGCGKSTLASALLRLLPSYAQYEGGTIRFLGRDLLSMSEPELRKLRGAEIVSIPQEPALALNPVMRVGTQISEVLRAHTDLTRTQRRDRVPELLREVGFNNPGEIGSAYPHQLSGGQRQRITIAQAIACRPALIVADEPTSKLDRPLQDEIVQLLSNIRRRHGIAFLFITHDPSLLFGFADRLVVMYAGRMVEEGNTRDVIQNPLHPYTQALLGLANSRPLATDGGQRVKLRTINGEPPDGTGVSFGCGFEPRCGDRIQVCACNFPEVSMPAPGHHVSCFKYVN
jgi:oligopeptide/dipeptide ABC transporter ATP-binding protein